VRPLALSSQALLCHDCEIEASKDQATQAPFCEIINIYIVKVCRYNVTKSSLLSLRAIYFAATNLDLNSNETTRPLIGMGIP